MNKKAKTSKPQLPASSPYAPGVPRQKISRPLIIMASFASMIVSCVLAALYIWLDHESEPTATTTVASSQPDMMVSLLIIAIVLAFMLLPGVIVALIVLPKLRKK